MVLGGSRKEGGKGTLRLLLRRRPKTGQAFYDGGWQNGQAARGFVTEQKDKDGARTVIGGKKSNRRSGPGEGGAKERKKSLLR